MITRKLEALNPTPRTETGPGAGARTLVCGEPFEGLTKGCSSDAWRVAIHEAGHAVAAHALGVPLGEITIVPGRTGEGAHYAGLTNLNHGEHQVRRALDEYYDCDGDDDDGREADTLAFVSKSIQVSYAGKIAEELFFGDGDPSSWEHDFSSIHRCAERVCPPDAQEIAETSIAISPDATYEGCLDVAREKAASTPLHEVDHFKSWLECRTRKLVHGRRRAVEAVARCLLVERRLSPADTTNAILTAMREAANESIRSHKAGGTP